MSDGAYTTLTLIITGLLLLLIYTTPDVDDEQ